MLYINISQFFFLKLTYKRTKVLLKVLSSALKFHVLLLALKFLEITMKFCYWSTKKIIEKFWQQSSQKKKKNDNNI